MVTRLIRSSIGQKILMAATGLALLGFVIGHLLGNLQVFLGPEALNAYALKLRHFGPWLWAIRGVLLAAVLVHIWTSVRLSIQNGRARPVGYRRYRAAETSLGARTMLLSGSVLLLFIVYHLLHFTFRTTDPRFAGLVDPLGHYDVYRMVLLGFEQPAIVLLYLVGMAGLFSHLGHGIASAFQTLGLNNERMLMVIERAGDGMAWLLFLGYSAIPLAIVFGLTGGAAR